MVKVCAIKSCPSGRQKKKKIKTVEANPQPLSFFQPTTPKKLQNWSKSLGISLKSTEYICQLHFKEEHIRIYDEIQVGNVIYLSYLTKKVLKEEALPTIEHQSQFIPDPEQNQGETQTCGANQDQQPEPIENIIEKHRQMLKDADERERTKHLLPIDQLINNIKSFSILPAHWLYMEKTKGLEFLRLDPISKQTKNHIRLNEDLSISVVCLNDQEISLDKKIISLNDIYDYLKSVEKWPLCVGTQIESEKYSKECKGIIFGDETYKRLQMHPRCKSCRALRNRLK